MVTVSRWTAFHLEHKAQKESRTRLKAKGAAFLFESDDDGFTVAHNVIGRRFGVFVHGVAEFARVAVMVFDAPEMAGNSQLRADDLGGVVCLLFIEVAIGAVDRKDGEVAAAYARIGKSVGTETGVARDIDALFTKAEQKANGRRRGGAVVAGHGSHGKILAGIAVADVK